jgi:hypothetical protein
MSSAPGPRIGVWGAFDVADYGNLLVPRIFENELLRRLPHARVFAYAPLGAEHPISMDGGRPAAPLGDWTPARRAQLAEQLDLVVISGSDVIHLRDGLHREPYAEEASAEGAASLEPSRFFVDGLSEGLEQRCPVVWHAIGVPFEFAPEEADRANAAIESKRHVSVQSVVSRERLLATGTKRQIDLVGDPALLTSRLLSDETMQKRLRYLRAVKRYPVEDPPLMLETSAALGVDNLAQALSEARAHDPKVPVALVALSPARGDAQLARTLASRIDDPIYELTEDVTLNDHVAAIANARAFCGVSSAGCSTARAFGVPTVRVAAEAPHGEGIVTRDPAQLSTAVAALLGGEITVDSQAVRVFVERLDAEFDTIAAIAEDSWSERLETPGGPAASELAHALAEAERRHEALLRAYLARGERLLAEQQRVGELLDALEVEEDPEAAAAQTRIELADARNRLDTLDAAAAEARIERDQAGADLERVRAERDELRAQLSQALADNRRPAILRRLLPRRG